MEEAKPKQETAEKKPVCGIIMPISPVNGYSDSHWQNVLELLHEVINSAGFKPNLVSLADEVNIIQSTIVNNIYNNDIVVCDVSARNPNVAFELGMRLTFDKPTVIIKDDITSYPFDISIVEYIQYRHDLRYHDMLKFKEALRKKIVDTYELKKKNESYSPFLKHFGQFSVPKLEQKEVQIDEYIINRLTQIQDDINTLKATVPVPIKASKIVPSLKQVKMYGGGEARLVIQESEIHNYIKRLNENYSDLPEEERIERMIDDLNLIFGISFSSPNKARQYVIDILIRNGLV